MTDNAQDIALRLFEFSTLEWMSEDRLSVQVLGEACLITFAELRSLEDCGFVVALNSPLRPEIQRDYDLQKDGELGASCCLVLTVPRELRKLVVARDLEDLLSVSRATSMLPKAYILTHDASDAGAVVGFRPDHDSRLPAHLRDYHSAIRMWEILEGQAHHTAASGALLFFGLWKVEISPGFALNDVRGISAGVRDVDIFMSNPDRQDTRREIFSSALSEFLRDQDPWDAFAHILRGIDRFARRLREGLALFLYENSPEKLAEEGRKQHFELAEKLDKTVGSIELKALSIPISLLLVVKQAEAGNGLTILNGILIAAVILYWLAMTIAHCSHLTTLKLVRDRVEKAIFDLKRRGLEAANPLLSVEFASLETRLTHCCRGIWLTWAFSVLPLAAVLLSSFLA